MPDKKLLGAIAFAAAAALLATPSLTAAQEADDGTTTTTEDGTAEDPANEDSGRGGCVGKADFGTAAEAIGVTEDELRTALADGQSIAEVAEANGVDVQAVIEALVAEATTHIDEEVVAGDITAEEGQERKAALLERITEAVNREGLPSHGRHRPPAAEEDADAEGS